MSDFREVVFSPLGEGGVRDGDEDVETIRFNDFSGPTASRQDKSAIGIDSTDSSAFSINADSNGGSTVWGASFNFVNSIVGAGIIGSPFVIT